MSTRVITTHKINPCNDRLLLEVLDGPGAGGACHEYLISLPPDADSGVGKCVLLEFQNGAIGEVGVNGITHEVLLAILIDRLEAFQAGVFACKENQLALQGMKAAQHWLLARTQGRMDRGVEGKTVA